MSSTPTKKPLQPLPAAQVEKSNGRPYQVYRQGFLLKPVRGMRKRLVRYWFVLFEQKDLLAFLYFLDEDHYLERKKNEGFIRIDDSTSIDVVPEFMGRKNSFCITTPRNKFYLVSESRYELHEWLLALHNAVDGYKEHTLQRKKRHSRQRNGSTSGSNAGKTPPSIKPSRPAPPVPQSKKKENESPNTMTELSPSHNLPSPTTSPLDAIVAGLLAETNEMNEVEYNMTEEEEPEYQLESNLGEVRNGGNSTSMPALNSKEGTESPQDSSCPNSQDNDTFCASYDDRNTLPLDNQSHKRPKKRNSTKGLRSVSPPNLPPPPPPPPPAESEQENEEQFLQVMNSFSDFGEALHEITTQVQQHKPTAARKPMPPQRTSSLSPKKQEEHVGNDSVKTYLDEAFQQEDSHGLSSDEEGAIAPPPPPLASKTKETSPSILRKEDKVTAIAGGKRNVMFEDNKRVNPSYEPRIDRETNRPLSVAEAKMKLYGEQETKVTLYRRSQNLEEEKSIETHEAIDASSDEIQSETHPTQSNDNIDDLVLTIETALESTSYMETPPTPPQDEPKKGFIAMVGDVPPRPPPPRPRPPLIQSVSPPACYTLSSDIPSLVQEEEDHRQSPVTQPSPINGGPVWSNGTSTVYRSMV